MPKSDPLEILLAHDQWATQQLLNACAGLPDEQFHQKFEIGRGSLHDTLVHVLAAMRTWTQTLAGVTPGPRLDEDGLKHSIPELKTLVETFFNELIAEAHKTNVAQTATRTRNGKTFTFTRGAILTHVATHDVHHRAQCLNMLRQLGVQKLPLSSVAEWTWSADAG